MRIYLAGEAYGKSVFEHYEHDFNRLASFFYVNHTTWQQENVGKYKNYILDSGAFTFIQNASKAGDIDSYVDKYIDFVNAHAIDLFFEMDVDSVLGYNKVKELRKRIEKGTGKPVIPVFHFERGIDDFIAMCKEYKYISIGTSKFSKSDHRMYLAFVMAAQKYNCKVHGLGVTGMTVLSKVPFYSVDSSSWTSGNRYRGMYHFNGKKLILISASNKLKGMRITEHYNLAIHNFGEWLKFCDYMENQNVV